ncbi:MAG TPA: dihydropteroate synthase [Syntrophorhabdales bacterium]|nr:dihydropteroate synthase [Syntrophorhabdales bacterium]
MGWRQRFEDRPLIMGILNVTPDSFYDGGKFYPQDVAITHALRLIEEGADILDVGGESTRPYSDATPAEEELRRVIPVIREIRARSTVFLSVDTYKAAVAREAIEAGADMINDISGLTFDPETASVAAQSGVPVVIMHTRGRPKEMQVNPGYEDVIGQIKEFFVDRVQYAKQCGVQDSNIVLDPGIGFGKRVEDNLTIIKDLRRFKELGYPILIGTSMKGFIGKLAGSPELEERIEGTLASLALSLWNGADILRVHDVKKAKKVAAFVQAVMAA